MNPPQELIDVLGSARRPVIVGHITPDVDALGAMLSLARSLPVPQVAVALRDARVGSKLHSLVALAGDIPRADPGRIADADIIVVVDTAAPSRVHVPGKWDAIADKFVVNIDHHITNPDFGRVNWVVDSASSTCEMVYRLIAAADWRLDPVTASLLFAGIYTDTGRFSLPNAGAGAFEAAGALVRAGADVERIALCLYRAPPHEFDLLRTVYRNTRLAADGCIAYSTLTYEEIHHAGCKPEDIDDQVSIPRSLSGVRMAILFSEGNPGVVRINFRGEEGTPVLPLAGRFGGGGHTFSAGARVRGEMDTVVRQVLGEAAATFAPPAGPS